MSWGYIVVEPSLAEDLWGRASTVKQARDLLQLPEPWWQITQVAMAEQKFFPHNVLVLRVESPLLTPPPPGQTWLVKPEYHLVGFDRVLRDITYQLAPVPVLERILDDEETTHPG